MKRDFQQRMRQQRGVAAVETVIALPVLLLLFMATGEIGRAFMQYNTLEKGLRDGAQYLATHSLIGDTGVIEDPLPAADQDAARNLARYGNVNGTGDTLVPGYTEDMLTIDVPDESHITLAANYTYQPVLFDFLDLGNGLGVSAPVTMQASVTMRAIERF